MKLKNKEENRLEELEGVYVADGKIFMATIDENGTRNLQSFGSFAELQKTFGDYEEPKECWYIGSYGDVFHESAGNKSSRKDEIGNYFSSRAEAEKVVEKLKAIRRLKDKGLSWEKLTSGAFSGERGYWMKVIFRVWTGKDDSILKDLETIFGGEE